MQLSLNPESGQPLIDQIVQGTRRLIDDRALMPGTRLPPIRTFAEQHGVSRFTVVEAYDKLIALGYLYSKRGSGFFVSQRTELPVAQRGDACCPKERAFDNAGVMYQSLDNESPLLKVGIGWLPPEWLDQEGISRNIRSLTRRKTTRFVGYGTPRGFRPLRELLQRQLGDIGIQCDPSQIILTQGATQALDLVARHFLKPGDCVFVEDPGYWNLFSILLLYGVKMIGVPRTEQGPDPDALESLLKIHRPKLFFTNSVLQNPTSSNLTAGVAFRILRLADQYDFMVVEDDIYADMHPGTPTRLAQLDQLKRVIYISGFSKTLSANLRVGYLACSTELAAILTDIKIISVISNSEFSEQLIYLMLIEGHYRKFLDRVRGRLAEAAIRTVTALERAGMHIPAPPAGGMFVWAEAPGLQDASELATHASRAGIMLAPGNIFRPQIQPSSWLRFNVAYADAPILERFLSEQLSKLT